MQIDSVENIWLDLISRGLLSSTVEPLPQLESFLVLFIAYISFREIYFCFRMRKTRPYTWYLLELLSAINDGNSSVHVLADLTRQIHNRTLTIAKLGESVRRYLLQPSL